MTRILGANFTKEMELIKEQYVVRTSETVRAVKTAMAFAPRDLWRCDARTPKLGTFACLYSFMRQVQAQHFFPDETYTKLTQLFQGYIVNEVDLNKDSSCKENCAYYGYAKVHGCYKDQFCAQQRKCNGKVLNCEYIDSDMWICPSVN